MRYAILGNRSDSRCVQRGSPYRILWILRTGALWRELPERYGLWRTVASRFYRWQKAGILQRILQVLQQQADATLIEGFCYRSTIQQKLYSKGYIFLYRWIDKMPQPCEDTELGPMPPKHLPPGRENPGTSVGT